MQRINVRIERLTEAHEIKIITKVMTKAKTKKTLSKIKPINSERISDYQTVARQKRRHDCTLLLYRLHREERVHVVRKERKRRRRSRHGFRLLSKMEDLRRQIRCVGVLLESAFSWRANHERFLSLTVWSCKLVTCQSYSISWTLCDCEARVLDVLGSIYHLKCE